MKISRYFLVGFVFIIAALTFVGGLLYIQDISIKQSNYSFTVLFENVQGLNVGDQVDMLGKKVGKVSQTRIKGPKIAVVLSIDNSFAFSIPIDSKIEIKSEGLIGSKFISITPGLNRKDFILPGSTVEGIREVDFSEITPDILPLTQDLSAFARQLKATLGEEERDRIRSTIKNIESITTGIDTFLYNNRSIINDDDRTNFRNFIKNLNGAVKDLKYGINKEIGKIDDMLDDFKQVTDKSEDISFIITGMKENNLLLSEVAKQLNSILNKIDSGQGTIGRMLEDETLYDNMNSLVDETKLFIKDLKNNPSKYMKAYRKSK